jgi:hypothetical protein
MAETAAPNTLETQRLAALRENQARKPKAPAGRGVFGNLARGAMLAGALTVGAGADAEDRRRQDEIASQAEEPEYSPTAAAREAVRASRLQETQAQKRGGVFAQARADARGRPVGQQGAQIAQAAAGAQRAEIRKRDEQNDLVSKSALSNPLAGIAWFNLQLVWGYMVRKGQDKMVSPPSWRFLNIPLLPDSSARAAILMVDGMIAFSLFLGLVQLLLIIILVYALANPAAMSDLVLGLLGPVSDFLYGFLPAL